ncbi:hypothetical protein ABTB62_20100, partial [Acinetobacter baumannii]
IRKQQNRIARRPAADGALEPYKFIVTGFNSFGKNLENPSGLTAKSLSGEIVVNHHPVTIDGMVLETCCKKSWTAVKKALGVKP